VKEHTLPLVSKIAFGSCGSQDRPMPVLALAAKKKPDVFVFLGDNIYGDTEDMNVLQYKYNELGAKKEFQKLQETAEILATWDDHDYGRNDAGRHHRFKKESKEHFLNFWKVPQDDVRRTREGIYTSYYFEGNGRTVQIILLDLRFFRDNLRKYNNETVDTIAYHYGLDYWPYQTADSTLMGEPQWNWLKEQFQQPADVRIIASSTQFGITWNSYEAWANFPHERQRMLNLIKETKANGVVFISGDVHYAEISKLKEEGLYPIYDITSSGITSTWEFATPNFNRIDGPIMENHFGMIEIDWQQPDPELSFKIIDVKDKVRIDRKVKLSELKF
jgi:alkaline phosphatase D